MLPFDADCISLAVCLVKQICKYKNETVLSTTVCYSMAAGSNNPDVCLYTYIMIYKVTEKKKVYKVKEIKKFTVYFIEQYI